MTLVGRQAIFNPINNGGVYYYNGVNVFPQKHLEITDGTIVGTIVQDLTPNAMIAGPFDLNGEQLWYLIPKSTITLLDNNITDVSQINRP